MFGQDHRLAGSQWPSWSARLCVLVMCWQCGVCCAQVVAPDKVDEQRSLRYIARLKALQEARVHMRDRASSLMAHNPNLEQEMQSALAASLVSAGALQATPEVTATPNLLSTYRAFRGQSGEIYLQPELLIWYAFQDNTLVRQQLFLSMASAQQSALQSYASLQSSRVALEQLAENADQNFLDFRHLSDVLGRRSSRELTEAEALTATWTQADPLHAGATLVRAHGLRSMGRFDECMRMLDQLDNNFPTMQSIVATISAQVAYLGGDVDEAKRQLDKGLARARESGAGEAYLVYGWISMSEQKWSHAKNLAVRLRTLSPNDIETAILEALATAYERPTRAREALQILRRAQLNSSPDDWHYHEALAVVHIMARDHQFARREIAAALAVAPSHVRGELEREQQEILNAKVPAIDWRSRLVQQWLR